MIRYIKTAVFIIYYIYKAVYCILCSNYAFNMLLWIKHIWIQMGGKNRRKECKREKIRDGSKAPRSIKLNKLKITLSVSVCDAGLLHTTLTKPHKAPLPCISPHWGYYLHTSLPSPPRPLPPHHVTPLSPTYSALPSGSIVGRAASKG